MFNLFLWIILLSVIVASTLMLTAASGDGIRHGDEKAKEIWRENNGKNQSD